MARSIRVLANAAKRWLATPTGRRARAITAAIIIVMALGGVTYQLAYGVDAVDWSSVTLNWTWIALAAIPAILSQLLGGVVWMLILAAMGHHLPLGRCLVIHINASLAKYIPGYAWQLLGKAVLTRREGVPTRDVSLALVCELTITLLTAILVAATLLPGLQVLGYQVPGWTLVLAASGAAGCLFGLPWMIRYATKRMGGSQPAQIDARPVWLAQVVFIVAWLLLGSSTTWLCNALGISTTRLWPAATSSLALSFVVSLLVFVVPAGVGIREGTLTSLLEPRLGGGSAALLALLSRLILSLAEVLCFVALWAIRLASSRNNRSITQRGDATMDGFAPGDHTCPTKPPE